jgi:hypothetical protein
MSISVTVRREVATNGLAIVTTKQHESDAQLLIDDTIPAGDTNREILAAIDLSKAKVIAIKSDKNLTLKTNSSSAPANTINLLANVTYLWETGGYFANLLTTNVTKFFVTNANVTDATFAVIVLSEA